MELGVIFVLIIRFIAITAGMALNMRRISKTPKRVDDILWIASIVIGIALGWYWRSREGFTI